ncbi:MAG: VanW family protein [Ardenticatenia bacterium]|nr:VanW family protein [Ardenticatenia bacterium]
MVARRPGSWWGVLAAWCLALATLFAVAVWATTTAYADRIYPGVTVEGVPLGGLSPETAEAVLRGRLQEYGSRPVVLRAAGRQWAYTLSDVGYRLHVEATVARAYAVGREGALWRRPLVWWNLLRGGYDIAPVHSFDAQTGLALLSLIARELHRTPQDARVDVVGLDAYARPALPGRTLDIEASLQRLRELALRGEGSTVELVVVERPPLIRSAEPAASRARRLLTGRPRLEARVPTWVGEGKTARRLELPLVWAFRRTPLSRALRVIPVEVAEGQRAWQVDADMSPLKDEVATLVARLAQPPRDARFDYNPDTGTLRPLIVSQPGITVDPEAALRALKAAWLEGRSTSALPVQITWPAVSTADAGRLEVSNIVAVGESTFGGSPPAREQNIAVSSARFHGIVIPPHTEVSFNTYLGEILDATGYEESYIILGNRTAVGIGGGICQVSTTLFRAAFFAGFQITERRAHGYRVRYYEPPIGLDATVFSPYVDFKFRNDTDNYYLLQRELDLKAKRLRFVLYGPDTGRMVEMIGPQVLEITPHGDPIYEEDPSLPAGVIKQVDWAQDGARVKVERIVRHRTTGEVIYHDVFWSTYRPWVARYLVGTGP